MKNQNTSDDKPCGVSPVAASSPPANYALPENVIGAATFGTIREKYAYVGSDGGCGPADDLADDSMPDPAMSESFYRFSGARRWEGEGVVASYSQDEKKKKKKKYPTPVTTCGTVGKQAPVHKDFFPIRMEEELVGALTPSDEEDFDDLRSSLKILQDPDRTVVFAVVVDLEDDDKNQITAIRCNGGTAFGGYAHDRSRDSILVRCVECIQVGSVPFSYVMRLPGVGPWQAKVPLSAAVVEKHLPPKNKIALDEWRAKWSGKRYDVQFVQMLGCN